MGLDPKRRSSPMGTPSKHLKTKQLTVNRPVC